MAITKYTIDSNTGTDLPNAYIKIPHFSVWNDETLLFGVNVFSNQQARLDNKQPMVTVDYRIPFTGSVTYSDLYNHLKSLPEFAGAVDC